MIKQEELFELIKRWLESHGFKVFIPPHGKHKIVASVADLDSTKSYIEPDLIGIRDAMMVVVEVETNLKELDRVMAKCMFWKITATLVYIAYPEEICPKLNILERFGIGLLSVSKESVKEKLIFLNRLND